MSDRLPATMICDGRSTHAAEPASEQPRLALRPREAAKALGIGARLLWSMTNRGEVPHIKIGRAVLYPIAELERWLSERAQKRGGNRR